MARAKPEARGGNRIDIPEQGISLTLATPEEVLGWFNDQLKFWDTLQSEVGGSFSFAGRSYETTNFFNQIKALIVAAQKGPLDESNAKFQEMIARARRLQLIIAGGSIDQALTEVRTADSRRGSPERSQETLGFLFCYCYPFWPSELRTQNLLISVAGALAAGHPAAALLRYSHDLNEASKTTREITRAKELMDQKIANWSDELNELKTLYEARISLEAPATYWDRRRRISTYIAIAAAVSFIMVLVAAGVGAAVFAGDLLAFVETHSTALTVVHGVLVVAAPLFAIGWVLKHISRVLIQSLNNANDAAFRKALVETFLSVAQQLKAGMAEQDRALILNALFRPAPGEPHDEGPPAGVLDLITKRPA